MESWFSLVSYHVNPNLQKSSISFRGQFLSPCVRHSLGIRIKSNDFYFSLLWAIIVFINIFDIFIILIFRLIPWLHWSLLDTYFSDLSWVLCRRHCVCCGALLRQLWPREGHSWLTETINVFPSSFSACRNCISPLRPRWKMTSSSSLPDHLLSPLLPPLIFSS